MVIYGHQGALDQRKRKKDRLKRYCNAPRNSLVKLCFDLFALHAHTLVMDNTRRNVYTYDTALKLKASDQELVGLFF